MHAQRIANGSGVHENDPNKSTTSVLAPMDADRASTDLELEAGEVREGTNDGEQTLRRNSWYESIHDSGLSIPALANSKPATPTQDVHPTDIPSPSDVRRILDLLVALNAQARMGGIERTLPAEPRAEIQVLLTDRICRKFVEQMRVVEEQGSLSNGINGSSDLNDNKAPSSLRNSIPNLQIPVPLSIVPPTLAASCSESIPSATSSITPLDEGIAIPLDSTFFKSSEREEGEIMSSSVTPPNGRRASPLKKYSIDDRSPQSPGPARHPLPTLRTYRAPLSPDKPKRPPPSPCRRSSRSSLSPEPPRRSRSPNYARGPLSPDRRTSLPPPHGRQSSPNLRSYRPYESRSPISPRFPQQRRVSEHDVLADKPSDHEPNSRRNGEDGYRNMENKHQSPFSGWHELTRKNNDDVISSDRCTPSHERQQGPLQGPQSDTAESSSVQRMSVKPMSPTNNNEVDCSLVECSQDCIGSGVAENMPSSSAVPKSSTSDVELPVMRYHDVPGVWMAKVGADRVEIATCGFEIDRVVADGWGIRGPSRHGKEKALSLSLICLPILEVAAVRGTLNVSTATPQDVANVIAQIESVWPPAGHIIIEVNPDREWGRSWLPRHLGDDCSSLDITEHVHVGTNVIRLIQLAGLANYMFLVLAKEKPPNIFAEPIPDAVETGEPQTMEQLLNSFRVTTQIIYS